MSSSASGWGFSTLSTSWSSDPCALSLCCSTWRLPVGKASVFKQSRDQNEKQGTTPAWEYLIMTKLTDGYRLPISSSLYPSWPGVEFVKNRLIVSISQGIASASPLHHIWNISVVTTAQSTLKQPTILIDRINYSNNFVKWFLFAPTIMKTRR